MNHERAYLSWQWRRSPICYEEEREEIWVLGFGLEKEEREREKREREERKRKKEKRKPLYSHIIFFLLQQNVLL
jgi:hypothetical protein